MFWKNKRKQRVVFSSPSPILSLSEFFVPFSVFFFSKGTQHRNMIFLSLLILLLFSSDNSSVFFSGKSCYLPLRKVWSLKFDDIVKMGHEDFSINRLGNELESNILRLCEYEMSSGVTFNGLKEFIFNLVLVLVLGAGNSSASLDASDIITCELFSLRS